MYEHIKRNKLKTEIEWREEVVECDYDNENVQTKENTKKSLPKN